MASPYHKHNSTGNAHRLRLELDSKPLNRLVHCAMFFGIIHRGGILWLT